LQRRLEQARRMTKEHDDPLTRRRLEELIRILKGQLNHCTFVQKKKPRTMPGLPVF
jgi:hypothetical protein